MTFHDLPAVNAALNGLSACFLTCGFFFIKRGHKIAHRNCMISALCTSVVFLACYVTYHSWVAFVLHQGPTRFLKPEWFRPIYLTILLTHTVLAAAIVPMILITLNRALKERFDCHKKIARWTWPLWMYVSVTGVLIYWLLYIKFPQQ
jgi:putative membrane protein